MTRQKKSACEAVGGKFIGCWYCLDDYDFTLIADVPNNESMAGSLAIAAGGAVSSPPRRQC
jgi:uncharacterized protein with GYD domain